MQQAEDMQRAVEEAAGASESVGGNTEQIYEAQAQAMAESIDNSLPAFLELVWAMNRRDIQQTLKGSCTKLLNDASVPKEMRMKRAEALRVLGAEFLAVGKAKRQADKLANNKDHGFGADSIKARLQVAAMTTMAKAQGQEVSHEDTEEMIRFSKEAGASEAATGSSSGEGETPPASLGDDKKDPTVGQL